MYIADKILVQRHNAYVKRLNRYGLAILIVVVVAAGVTLFFGDFTLRIPPPTPVVPVHKTSSPA